MTLRHMRILAAVVQQGSVTKAAESLHLAQPSISLALRELEEDGLRVLGTREVKRRTGVVSVDFLHADNGEMAFRLEQEYGIETRCGLHCAPMAHRTLGTFPQGAVRFSVGPFTRFEEIDYVHGAVYELLLETGG